MELMIGKGLLLIGSYLYGAIPFGLLIAKRFYDVDIRQHGSKNVGATNVWRVLGKKPGLTTLMLDILKGVLPVIAARRLFPDSSYLPITTGFVAIAGHNWSIFLMGSGGKGVATSAGVFIALMPLQAAIALATFLVFFLSTRHVSVGSIMGSVALLIATLLTNTSVAVRSLVLIAAIMILVKHIPNMKRLARGEELKVNLK